MESSRPGTNDPKPPHSSIGEPETGEPRGTFRSTALEQSMGLYLPATVAFRLVNFGRILLLVWFMSPQQYGLLSMILLVVNVMTPLCSLGLNEAVARYVPQYEQRGSMAGFLRRSLTLLLGVTAASVALILFFSPVLGDFFYAQIFTDAATRLEFSGNAPQLARLSGVVIGLMIVYFYLLSVVKGLRMFGALSRLELSHGLLFLAFSLVVIVTGRLSAFTLTALYGASLAIPIVYFGLRLFLIVGRWRAQAGVRTEDHLARKLLKFSIWTTLAGVTWQVLLFYPQWFLNKVHGPEVVAVFSAVRQIGSFVLIGAVAVSTVVMTTVTKTWESQGRQPAEQQLSLAFRGTGFGLFVLCAVIALAKGWIMRMFHPDYAPGEAILPLQLLFFLFGAFLAFLPGHFHLREKTRHMFWPWATGVAANILLAYWLVGPRLATIQAMPLWQKAGAVLSTVFTTGFSDAQGLGGAAWCGVFAIGLAMLLCVVLVRAECCSLDRGTYVVIAASLLLATRPWILGPGVVVLILAALWTDLIFDAGERRKIIGYVFGSLQHVPLLKMLGRREHGEG